MRRAAEAGAVVLPAMPGFYHGVRSIRDLVDFVVARICDQLGVDNIARPALGDAERTMLAPLRIMLEMIRFSHTLFALPFALLAAVMAWRPWLSRRHRGPGRYSRLDRPGGMVAPAADRTDHSTIGSARPARDDTRPDVLRGSFMVRNLGFGLLTVILSSAAFAGQACGQAEASAGWTDRVPKVPGASQYFVAPDGRAENAGTKGSPWDLGSVLGGRQRVAPGRHRLGAWWDVQGSQRRRSSKPPLQAQDGAPVIVRGYPGERATLVDCGIVLESTGAPCLGLGPGNPRHGHPAFEAGGAVPRRHPQVQPVPCLRARLQGDQPDHPR